MNEWVDGQMSGRMEGGMNEWVDGQISGWREG